MSWSPAEVAESAAAYRRRYDLRTGDRAARLRAEAERDPAAERVDDEALAGTLPVEVLDALLADPDEEYRGFVAAGPLEDALGRHPQAYGPVVAARARADAVWRKAVGGVWLSRPAWLALPGELRGFVGEPAS